MTAFEKFQTGLENVLGPVSQKISSNAFIQAIAAGMTMFLPVTLGGAVCSLLANFPLPAVTAFLTSIGIGPILQAIADCTIGLMGVLVVFGVAYRYAQRKEKNPGLAGIFALSSFFAFMPATVGEGETAVAAFKASYMGSSGIFVGIILGLFVSWLYCRLADNKKLMIRLPDSVPPMVAQSLSPMLVGILVFFIIALVRFAMSLVTDRSLFDLINALIAAPLMKFGATPWTFMFLGLLSNLLFFIGIHPVSVTAVMAPLLITSLTKAIEEFSTGAPLSNLETLVTYMTGSFGGTGSTLPLLILFLIFAKSERYKTFTKATIIPNLMEINEPVIFGMPVVFNAYLFIPFVLSSLPGNILGYLAAKTGFISSVNPAMMMALPFTTPTVFKYLLIGGWKLLLIGIVQFILITLLYYPFMKILDNQALAEEKASAEAGE
ncbi:MAG: PTS sugar transporter subunit IIC [Erysipelotrichaceae bacterium]|nr:PTS sugar transporter subunit IIC [Erysipelotrichaceae bacterium]